MADTKQPAAGEKTMPAWLYANAGNNLATALKLDPHARRPPTPLPSDRALVRVTHASLNPADYKVPEMGRIASYLYARSSSISPGMDFAGVIEEINPTTTTTTTTTSSSPALKKGDKVYGRIYGTSFGPLGTYVQPAISSIIKLPPSVSPADASTLGTAAGTAYQAIAPYVVPGRGDEVFINGGSGGVGTYAIQIAARALGCVVTASCSSRNISLCKDLGAGSVIDYTTSPTAVLDALRARGRVFRLVVDNVASPGLYEHAAEYTVPDATYVQIGGGFSMTDMSLLTRRTVLPAFLGGGKRKFRFLLLQQRQDELAQLGQWLEEGKIRAVIDGDVFAFEDVPKAFEKLKTGRTRGKIVVKVSD
ncbi:NAD(P)-binding protein [Poronia punctata]|nr:NAD(P)-binding protein [Poronia punctata]